MKKKKLLSLAALAISSFGLMAGVNAATVSCDGNEIAKVGEKTCYDNLPEALTSAKEGDTVYLKQSVDINTLEGSNNIKIISDITLDLGSKELSFSGNTSFGLFVNGTTATIKNGKINQTITEGDPVALFIGGKGNVTLENVDIIDTKYNAIVVNSNDGAIVTVNDDATVKCTGGQAISVLGEGTNTVNVYGELVSGNDYTAINASYLAEGPVNVNIYKGAQVTGGVLQMSTGKVSIEGTVTNSTSAAVVMFKGSLEVKEGAVIKSTSQYKEVWKPSADNTVTDDGSAIFIEPKDSVNVTINGGEIISDNAYAVSAPDLGEANKKITISIEKGTFKSAKGGINILNFDKEKFISGGTTFLKNGTPDEDVLKYTDGLNISNTGLVGKKYTITPEESVNGSFTVPDEAIAGETVTVTVTPASGYQLDKITVTKGEENIAVNADNTFVMPDGAVTVKVTFKLIPSKPAEDKNDIVVEEPKGDENVTLSTEASDILKESLLNTEDEELKEILENNENVTIALETEKITKESLSKEEIEKFESIIENAKISEFFDLNIVVKADGLANHYLKELNKAITLSVALPELPEVAKGYARKYYILREHDGVIEKLDATISEDGKTLLFASDKFSKYAIAYVDEEIKDTVTDSNPSTIDSVFSFVTLAVASIGVLGVASKKIIKKMSF